LTAERLQKVLARAGIASRRHAEELITAGRVRVDGRLERELGVRVNPRAKIEVDGRVVVAEPLVYLVLHKPRSVVCTLKDPEGRPTVADYLKDVGARVVPVGRLDFHTSGALICTNDGEFASHLMHPRYHAKKEYVAKVGGVVDDKVLERFREQIVIDGRATRPAEVHLLRVEEGKSWLSVKLGEGRNRQVRRLGEHAGMPVMRLSRVAHAGITAEDLKPGEWRMLTIDELKALKREYGVPRRVHGPDARLGDTRGGHVTLRRPKAQDERARRGDKPTRDRHEDTSRRDARRHDGPTRDAAPRGDAPWNERPRRDAAPVDEAPRREAPWNARPRAGAGPRQDAPRNERPRAGAGSRQNGPRNERPRAGAGPRQDGPRNERPRTGAGPRHDGPRHERPRAGVGPRREGPRNERPRAGAGPRRDGPPNERPRADAGPRRDGPRNERPRAGTGPRRDARGEAPRREVSGRGERASGRRRGT
jgi:23S rRNA pseudouridine2605 synthase